MRTYVTVPEFMAAPTGINVNTLIPGGTQAANQAEMANILARASSWADTECHMILDATQDSEMHQVRPDRYGRLTVFPRYAPVLEVKSLQYRTGPGAAWQSPDQTYLQIISDSVGEGRPVTRIEVADQDYSPYRRLGQPPLLVQLSYVNGYPNTTLALAAAAGASSVQVTAAFGIYAGTVLNLFDGANTETITASSVSGNQVTLVAPLAFAHGAGVAASALPPAVKEAVILMAAFLVKSRGALSLEMLNTSPQRVTEYKSMGDVDIARSLLAPYRRVI